MYMSVNKLFLLCFRLITETSSYKDLGERYQMGLKMSCRLTVHFPHRNPSAKNPKRNCKCFFFLFQIFHSTMISLFHLWKLLMKIWIKNFIPSWYATQMILSTSYNLSLLTKWHLLLTQLCYLKKINICVWQ